MKNSGLYLSATVCAVTLCLSDLSFAQDKFEKIKKNDVTNYYEGFLLGTKILGSHVNNLQDEDVGTIDNLIVNSQTGRARYAVIGVGGFIGMDGTDVIVPWAALTVAKSSVDQAPIYVLDATKEKLKNAPRFEASKLADLYKRSTEEPIFTFYNIIWTPDILTAQEKEAKSKTKQSSHRGNISPSVTPKPTP